MHNGKLGSINQTLIIQKLDSLQRCLRRVEDKSPASAAELVANVDLQDIITLNLTRAVQLCVDIATHIIANSHEKAPITMGETFICLEKMGIIEPTTSTALRSAVGFRNIAVHDYEAVNWLIVHTISQRHLSDFKQFSASVAALCAP